MRDQLEITRKTAAYGPLVDGGDSQGAANLWAEDGSYDWGRGMTEASATMALGRAQLVEIFEAPEHRSIIRQGSAHWLSSPHVAIDGDRATSLCYSCLMLRDDAGFRLARVSVCLFEWVRHAGGWLIARRRNRLLDGSAEATDLLLEGLDGV